MIKCTADCAVFNGDYSFVADADALFKAMNDAWGYLKVLCYIAVIGSVASLSFCCYFLYLEGTARS